MQIIEMRENILNEEHNNGMMLLKNYTHCSFLVAPQTKSFLTNAIFFVFVWYVVTVRTKYDMVWNLKFIWS